MKSEEQKRKELAKFLWFTRCVKLPAREGRSISQAEMGRRCGGIAQGTYAQWEAGNRLPSDYNAHLLAGYFGMEVYSILDLPAQLPKNKWLLLIAENLPELTESQQKEYANRIYDDAEMMREQDNKLAGNLKPATS